MELKFKYYEDWWSNIVYVGVAITGDAGSSYTSIWELQAGGNSGPEEVTVDFTGIDNMQIALYYTGNANDIDFWYVDDLTLMDLDAVPVELSSFTAAVSGSGVILNWSTATETNNKGFEVERQFADNDLRNSIGNEWKKIGFVQGKGTTTEPAAYTFTDDNVKNGKYAYRLKQIDLDGSSDYSKLVEVEVNKPSVFSLKQNYPNPFNPSTKISFSLPVDARVSLDIYNVLGQKVTTLINHNLPAGEHNITFDASEFTSGIYFYQLEAKSGNEKKFSSVKKMILTK